MVNQNFMPLMLVTCRMNASLQTRGHLNSPKIGSQGLRHEQYFFFQIHNLFAEI